MGEWLTLSERSSAVADRGAAMHPPELEPVSLPPYRPDYVAEGSADPDRQKVANFRHPFLMSKYAASATEVGDLDHALAVTEQRKRDMVTRIEAGQTSLKRSLKDWQKARNDLAMKREEVVLARFAELNPEIAAARNLPSFTLAKLRMEAGPVSDMTPEQQRRFRESFALEPTPWQMKNLPPVELPDSDNPMTGDVSPAMEYRPFQEAAIIAGAERGSIAIGDEMGLGKTIQGLGIVNRTGAQRVLVVAPGQARETAWAKEARQWLEDKSIQVKVLDDCSNKNFRIPRGPTMAIVSYEALRNTRCLPAHQNGDWDMIILDEAHRAKNLDALQSQGIYGKPWWTFNKKIGRGTTAQTIDVPPHPGLQAPIKVALTGTFMRKDPSDYYGALTWLDSKEWGPTFPPGMSGPRAINSNYENFMDRYTVRNETGGVEGVINADELQARMRGSVLVARAFDDAERDAPNISYRTIFVNDIANAEDKAALERALEEERQKARIAIREMRSGNLRSLTARRGEIFKIARETGEAKVPVMADYVADVAERGEPLIFFARHNNVLEAMKDDLASRGIDSRMIKGAMGGGLTEEGERRTQAVAVREAVEDFQNGDVDVLLASIGTGEGYSAQRADRVIIGELDWTPSALRQNIGRARRIGRYGPIQVDYLVLNGSLDGRFLERMADKLDMEARTIGLSMGLVSWMKVHWLGL